MCKEHNYLLSCSMAKKDIVPVVGFGVTNHEVIALLRWIASEIQDTNVVCQDYCMTQEPEDLKARKGRRIAVRAATGKLSIDLDVEFRLSNYIA